MFKIVKRTTTKSQLGTKLAFIACNIISFIETKQKD